MASAESIYLFNEESRLPIPLQQVLIEAQVLQTQAKLIITQQYENFSDEVIQTVFYFPVDADTCFSKLTVKFGDEVLETVVDEREKVQALFQNALDEGKTAVSGGYATKNTQDVIRIRLGGFPQKSKAEVTLEAYQSLRLEDLSFALRIPLTYLPRYISESNLEKNLENKADKEEILTQLSQDQQQQGPTEYLWNLKIDVTMKNDLIRLQSKNHNIKYQQTASNRAEIEINEQDRQSIPLKDFVLLISDTQIGEPSLLRGNSQGDQGFILNFFPDFRTEQMKSEVQEIFKTNGLTWESHTAITPDISQIEVAKEAEFDIDMCEYIFLIDRSGSMTGARITLARECLKLFLYSLPPQSKFNVVSFGSSFELLFNESQEYNDITLNQAVQQVSSFEASLGGTELLKPLAAILQQSQSQNYNRQVFLLTDGAVWNVQQILVLIDSVKNSNLRINTFGIGSGCSTDLVKNVAKHGGGIFYFVDDPSDIENKVIEALSFRCLPQVQIEEIQVFGEQGSLLHKSNNVEQLANGALFTLKEYIPNTIEKVKEARIQIFYQTTRQKKIFTIQVVEREEFNQCVLKQCVGQVLKSRDSSKYTLEELVNISIKHQVIGPNTQFFACKKIFDFQTNQHTLVPIPHAKIQLVTIEVKLLTGKTIKLSIDKNATVDELKLTMQSKEGIPTEQQRIIYKGKDLVDERTLADYNVEDGGVFHLVLRLRGGGQVIKLFDAQGQKIYNNDNIDASTSTLIDIWKTMYFSRRPYDNKFKFFHRRDETDFLIEDIDKAINQIASEPYEFVLCEQISVALVQNGQKGTIKLLKYHRQYSINDLLDQFGLIHQKTQIRVNGKNFEESKSKALQELGITSKDFIEFETQSFKSIVFLQNAKGTWSETLLTMLQQNPQEFENNQTEQMKKLNKEVLYTLLGLKLLKQWYRCDFSKWKMIERKALNYLYTTLSSNENGIQQLIGELQI